MFIKPKNINNIFYGFGGNSKGIFFATKVAFFMPLFYSLYCDFTLFFSFMSYFMTTYNFAILSILYSGLASDHPWFPLPVFFNPLSSIALQYNPSRNVKKRGSLPIVLTIQFALSSFIKC